MTEFGKKLIICMVLNQIIRMMPDMAVHIADVTGLDPEVMSLNPDNITVEVIAIVWPVISMVIDWRILLALSISVLALYALYRYYDYMTLEDSDLFTKEEAEMFSYEISQKLLT
jgi:hypothetical protein